MVDAATSLPASTGAAIAASAGRGVAGGGWASAPALAGGLAATGVTGPGATPRPAAGVVLRFSLEGDGRGDNATHAGEDARTDAERGEQKAQGDADSAERKVEKLRTRLDPETLRLFTEVIDPVTREALYRVPPTPISETAEREGEFLARYERMASALALEPLPRPAARVDA